MMPIYNSHIRQLMEYCSCVWNTGYVGDIRVLESVQRFWSKHVLGLQEKDYGTRLKALNQFSVQGRLIRADLIYYWKVFHGKCAVKPDDLFTLAEHGGTRGHRYKVKLPSIQTDIRKRSFAVRCITAWNRLPDDVVSTTDVSQFKAKLADRLGETLFMYHQ